MASHSKKDFVLITNVEENKFYNQLLKDTGFDKDPRVKFVGTVLTRNCSSIFGEMHLPIFMATKLAEQIRLYWRPWHLLN